MDTVKRWAYGKGYMLKKGSSSKETHLLLNGGRLLIPREAEELFLKTYAKWVEAGKELFVVEQRTAPTFCMFVDLDYETKVHVSSDELRTVCRIIQEAVINQIGDHANRCVVSCADKAKQTREGFLKTGVHLVWPDVQIDTPNALRLRFWILHALNEAFGQNNWSKLVDSCVYAGSGLRLNGSIKRTQCSCKGRASNTCPKCSGSGEIFDRRKYNPLVCYSGLDESSSQLELCKASIHSQVSCRDMPGNKLAPVKARRESTQKTADWMPLSESKTLLAIDG
jgi:hypothetical protein